MRSRIASARFKFSVVRLPMGQNAISGRLVSISSRQLVGHSNPATSPASQSGLKRLLKTTFQNPPSRHLSSTLILVDPQMGAANPAMNGPCGAVPFRAADFPWHFLRGISPGKSALLSGTTAAFTSVGKPSDFAVWCQLVAPRRRCRAAPALRAACGRQSPLRSGSMRFLFIGSPFSRSLPPPGRLPSRSWLRMNLEALAKKVGYVGIFSRTVEDASANLHRLMTSQTCGFDEGVETWRESLSVLMQSDLRLLNWAGATFTEHEWRLILENVRSRL
jgi:hypothetical protein